MRRTPRTCSGHTPAFAHLRWAFVLHLRPHSSGHRVARASAPPFLLRRASLARHVAATSGLRGSQRGPGTARASPPPRPPPRVFLFCFRSIAHLRAKCLLTCSSNRGVIPSRRGAPGTRAIHYSCPLRAGGLSTAATSGPLSHGPTKEMGVGVVDIPVLASAVGYHSTGDSGRNQFLLVSGAACPPFHTAPALLLPLP